MRLDADRTHAEAAAAMRDAEGLVQIEMARHRRRNRRAATAPTCAFRLAPSR